MLLGKDYFDQQEVSEDVPKFDVQVCRKQSSPFDSQAVELAKQFASSLLPGFRKMIKAHHSLILMLVLFSIALILLYSVFLLLPYKMQSVLNETEQWVTNSIQHHHSNPN